MRPAEARVVLTDDTKPEPSPPVAVLRFKPGRRSFGSYNPRLEKKLDEIGKEKKAAAAELEAAAAEAEALKTQNSERAAIWAKADAHEAAERQGAVSDNEMAMHYAKYQRYLPQKQDTSGGESIASKPTPGPPEVVNAVRIHDQPAGASNLLLSPCLLNVPLSHPAPHTMQLRALCLAQLARHT